MNYTNNQNQQKGQQGQNNEVKRMQLDVEPTPFTGTMKTDYMTTMDLACIVNSMFRPVCADYAGSVITMDKFNGQLSLSLFFKDNGNPGNQQIKNIVSAVRSTNGSSPNERIRNYNIRNSNKTYEVTDDTKSIISDFINTRGTNKINWNQHITEVVDNTHTGYHVYVKVVGLDLNRILRAKYGKRVNGAYVDYAINVEKPLTQGYSVQSEDTNWLIKIIQLDTSKVEDLCKKVGMLPAQGSISMVRS